MEELKVGDLVRPNDHWYAFGHTAHGVKNKVIQITNIQENSGGYMGICHGNVLDNSHKDVKFFVFRVSKISELEELIIKSGEGYARREERKTV